MDLELAMQCVVALTFTFFIIGYGLKKIVQFFNLI